MSENSITTTALTTKSLQLLKQAKVELTADQRKDMAERYEKISKTERAASARFARTMPEIAQASAVRAEIYEKAASTLRDE